MTPAARVQSAAEVLDIWLAGAPVEQALTNWARASRYAGSKDRAAVRDHVFDAVRAARSFAALGGGQTGRALMLGALRAAGGDPAEVFTGARHGPPALTPAESAHLDAPVSLSPLQAADCPDWLGPHLQQALGADFAAIMAALRLRAPVTLRAHAARGGRVAAAAALGGEGIETQPNPLASEALDVTANARKVQLSDAYAQGLVELQDAASQAVVEALPLVAGQRVLDYCAGGGGKTLAMGARAAINVTAHDAAPARLADLPRRAARAGLDVTVLDRAGCLAAAPFDLVLVDAPCSGSGAWRRSPEGKWRLTPEKLADLVELQAQILAEAAPLVAPGGVLAYATCSLLQDENDRQIDAFQRNTAAWQEESRHHWTPLQGGDGFFLSILRRILAE